MWGFLIVTVAVLVAYGIGVAVDWQNSPSVPSALARAIARTMAVQSAEVTQTFALPNAPPLTGTAIYNTPDIWEGALSSSSPCSPAIRGVFVGNSEYLVSQGDSSAFNSSVALKMHEPISTTRYVDGRSPAQFIAFTPLIDAQHGLGIGVLPGVHGHFDPAPELHEFR